MEKKIVYIEADRLFHHPKNPRKDLGDLEELTKSIQQNGILQNLTVVHDDYLSSANLKASYYVVIGNRRLDAGKAAGLKEFPCVIAEMDEKTQLTTMLEENMQRSDLTWYEQAQGFQLMIDLGETEKTIAEKTGFSQATVRRRLKMAALDPKILEEVSGRQLSLCDFDELEKIEDPKRKNAALKEIGTSDFNRIVQKNVREEKVAKALPVVKKLIKAEKAKELASSDRWSSKYTERKRYDLEKDEVTNLWENVPKSEKELFYYLDTWGYLYIYCKAPKEQKDKRPQKEIDREKYVKETKEALENLSRQMRELRINFVKSIRLTSKNAEKMLIGAATVFLVSSVSYRSSYRTFYEISGIEDPKNYTDGFAIAANFLKTDPEKNAPLALYMAMEDSVEGSKTWETWGPRDNFPSYKKNDWLNLIYGWLIALGYEMSTEEKALLDGTHELYQDKDKAEDAK